MALHEAGPQRRSRLISGGDGPRARGARARAVVCACDIPGVCVRGEGVRRACGSGSLGAPKHRGAGMMP